MLECRMADRSLDDDISLWQRWRDHCLLASSWARSQEIQGSCNLPQETSAPLASGFWIDLSEHPVCSCFFAFELSPRERALALSISDPFTLLQWMLHGLGTASGSGSAHRRASRALSLSSQLQSILHASSIATASDAIEHRFSSDPLFSAPDLELSVSRMSHDLLRGRRQFAHAFGASGAVMIAGSASAAVSLPLFSALTALGMAALAGVSAMALFRRAPDRLAAARLLSSVYPELLAPALLESLSGSSFPLDRLMPPSSSMPCSSWTSSLDRLASSDLSPLSLMAPDHPFALHCQGLMASARERKALLDCESSSPEPSTTPCRARL